jgi:hypothetical protein
MVISDTMGFAAQTPRFLGSLLRPWIQYLKASDTHTRQGQFDIAATVSQGGS